MSGVRVDYRHAAKLIRPGPAIALGDALLKWYDETVWAKNGEGEVAFRPWPLEGTHRPTFCVWELGAVWHEQQAWSRFLRSARGAAARETYLRDTFEGEV